MAANGPKTLGRQASPARGMTVAKAIAALDKAKAGLEKRAADEILEPADDSETIVVPVDDGQEIVVKPKDDVAPDDTTEGSGGDSTVEGGGQASAIAASAEAKAHPQMALAAISSGMSLAQFKSAATASGQGRQSKLDRAMEQSGRLGPDAPDGKGQRGGVSAAVQAKIDANRKQLTAH